LEKIYENALAHRLRKQGVKALQQQPLLVYDEDGTVLGEYYADLYIEDRLIVELKAVKQIADEHVARPGGTVHEIPGPKRPFLALHDEQRLAGDDEKVLLLVLPVVHAHRPSRLEDADVDPELRELRLRLEEADAAQRVGLAPARLARIDHEPAFPGGDEPCAGVSERRLGNHGP